MQAPKQYIVRSIDLRTIVKADFNLMISPEEEKKYFVKQADSQYLRQIRMITGVSSKYNPYIIFVDINYHKDIAVILSKLTLEGIRIRGRRFVLGERSASMVRQGVLSMVDASIADELEERVTMGLDIKKTVLSKWYAYRGLALSSAHCVEDYVPKMIVVPDYKTIIPNQRIKHLVDKVTKYTNAEGKEFEFTQKDIAIGTFDYKLDAFDGVGLMHKNVARRIEEITHSTTPITSCIYRQPFIKGCLHVIDYETFYEERGIEYITDVWGEKHSVHDEMIILTESMYKGIKYFKKYGDKRDWDRYWEAFYKYHHCISIARTNFTEEEEPVYTRSNYQVLQTLDLPYEKFKTLAHKSASWVERIVSGDQLYTKCFLGIVDGKCNALNPYVAAIAKNDAMMKEPTVNKYIMSLLDKFINDMKCGKLYIKSCFKFIAPDLIALLEHIGGLPVNGVLGPDEFWTKGKDLNYEGEYVITRNPHICRSENVVLTVNNDPEIWKWCGHLTNVAMLNIKSLVAQRLNGADFDGDIALVNDNPLFIEGSDKDAAIVIDMEDKVTALEEENNAAGRVLLLTRTTKNMIGEYSNYGSVFLNRCPKTQEQIDRYDTYESIISITVGKSIDYAKTGVLYSMPRVISKWGRPLPYFMRYRSPYYARMELSKAPSNMNRLCRELEKWERDLKWRRKEKFDYSVMYNDDITYTQEQFDAIAAIFKDFCKESNEVQKYQTKVRRYVDKDIRQQFTKYEATTYIADWDALYQKYKKLCADVCDDQQIVANIATKLVHEVYKGRGRKFPWIVAPDGVVANVKPQEGIMVPSRDDEGDEMYLGRRYTMVPMNSSDLDISIEQGIFDFLEDDYD